MHFYLESDGLEGEMVDRILLDPYIDVNKAPSYRVELRGNKLWSGKLTITQIWWANVWFDVQLKYRALENVPIWTLPRDSMNYIDFRYFGGLKDRSEAESTGQLLVSTNGFAPAGSNGTMVMEFRKD